MPQEPPEVNVVPPGTDAERQDPLVERLRSMDWPRPDPSVRERCLGDFKRRIADLEGTGWPPPVDDPLPD
jgi:hypothetical protein